MPIQIRLVPAVLLLLWQSAAWALDIVPLLDTCPQRDPVYSQIRTDFEIRRNGVPVQDIPCSEPISQLPISQYTDELIVVQGLRAAFYMLGSTLIPWAPGLRLYDWMKSKMVGINISDTAGNSSCCVMLDGKRFFTLRAQDDFNRDFDRGWRGISGNIGLYAHELRHLDGFPHVSCCGTPNGCDQTYEETNLSPYGIQWWLNAHWLTGDLYVGFSCLAPTQIDEIADWHLTADNLGFRDRFCDNKPPELTSPAMPGGQCRSPAGVIEVVIDIRPKSDANRVNSNSRGNINVAILSADDFDSSIIDPKTIRFGATGTEAAPVHVGRRDVDGDGDRDMVARFQIQDTGIRCGDTSAFITGQISGGPSFIGSSTIQTVQCK